jgi:hypothetical protein
MGMPSLLSPADRKGRKRDPALRALLGAKWHSDRGDYPAKAHAMRQLFAREPENFYVDSHVGRFLGVTHEPTGFKVHLPSEAVPAAIRHREPPWRDTARTARKAAGALVPAGLRAAAAFADLAGYEYVLARAYTGEVHVGVAEAADEPTVRLLEKAAGLVAGDGDLVSGAPAGEPPPVGDGGPWVAVKRAYSPTLANLGRALNMLPSPVNEPIGGPGPVASMLAGGLLGAALGYGGGALAERLLPPGQFDRGRLRASLALLGLGAGAAPGALWGASRLVPDAGPDPATAELDREAARINHALEKAGGPVHPMDTGFRAFGSMPAIPTDEFGRVVWQDHNTPTPLRAATAALLDTAQEASGRPAWITPYDIARVVGDSARGLFVGRVLGALAGLRPDSQRALQETGTWASLLSLAVPQALPVFAQPGRR